MYIRDTGKQTNETWFVGTSLPEMPLRQLKLTKSFLLRNKIWEIVFQAWIKVFQGKAIDLEFPTHLRTHGP